jgi:hypothetical protein
VDAGASATIRRAYQATLQVPFSFPSSPPHPFSFFLSFLFSFYLSFCVCVIVSVFFDFFHCLSLFLSFFLSFFLSLSLSFFLSFFLSLSFKMCLECRCIFALPHVLFRGFACAQTFQTAASSSSRFSPATASTRRQGLAHILNQVVASATVVSLPSISDPTLSAPLHELIATLDEPVLVAAVGQPDLTFVRVAASLHRHDVAAAVAELRQIIPESASHSSPSSLGRAPRASSRDRAMALFADYLMAHGHHSGAAVVLRHVLWRARDRRGLLGLVNIRDRQPPVHTNGTAQL